MTAANHKTTQSTAMAPTVDEFFETVKRSNLFRRNRVSSVPAVISNDDSTDSFAEDFIDVDAIHKKEFRRLKNVVKSVRNDGNSLGVILSGDAGVGKSHLLAKLCRWAETEKTGCFVFLHNVIASPERMPRHFLRSVISVLVEGRESYRDCALYRLISRAIGHQCKENGPASARLTPHRAREIFQNATDALPLRYDPINKKVVDVLFRFFEAVNLNPQLTGPTRDKVDSIVDWLSGDPISETMAKDLGIVLQDSEGEAAEVVRLLDHHHIEQVLLILSQLCGLSRRVLLICLDQFDNLDHDQVSSLAQFLHGFIDAAKNLVMISAGVSEKVEAFRDSSAISVAQWNRMGQKEIPLHYSSPDEVRDLIDARLQPLNDRFADIPQLQTVFTQHAMFPISEKEFEKRFGSAIDIRPRDALSWAAESWEDQQEQIEDKGGNLWLKTWGVEDSIPDPVAQPPVDVDAGIDEAVSNAVNERIAELREHPGALPPDGDNLATVTERILKVCVDHGAYSIRKVTRIIPKGNNLPSYHLEVTEQCGDAAVSVLNGIAFLTTRNGNSAQHALNRLLKSQKKLEHRILVTDEQRSPLPQTPMAKQRYDQLLQLGNSFRHIKLDFQRYAELDALRAVMDQAADIVIEEPVGTYRSLTRDEVIQSLHRQNRFLQHALLKELLTEPTPIEPPTNSDSNSAENDAKISLKNASELIETIIRGNLGFSVCITSNAVTIELLDRSQCKGVTFEEAHAMVVAVAENLCKQGTIIAKKHLNGLLFMKAA